MAGAVPENAHPTIMPIPISELTTALDYDKFSYDAYGWDAMQKYKPIEHWEFEESDKLTEIMDISKIIVDTVTSTDEQKVVLLIQGKQGAGKSHLALAILWLVALRLAYFRWHDYTRWREIFNYVTNSAIMLKEDTDYLIKHMSKGQCYLLDDVYDAMAASEWYEQTHKSINSIMMTDRTDSTVTIITVPRGSWIDRIVRGIANYRCDVKRMPELKRIGYNAFKFVMLDWNEWSSKQVPNTPYLKTKGTVWEDAYYAMAPKELRDWYKAIRALKLESLKEQKRKPATDGKQVKENKGELVKSWLSNNLTYLEKKAGDKNYSAKFVNKKFKQATGCVISDEYMRQMMDKAKSELIELTGQKPPTTTTEII